MVNSVSNASSTTKTSIFYINDVHGQSANMERIKTASDSFDSFVPSTKTDKLKFSAGDTFLGEDLKLNKAAVKFLDSIKVNATAIGNHEMDHSPQALVDLTKDSKFKLMSLNAKIDKSNVLSSKVTKSYVEEKDGTKYGVIGLLPFDLFKRIKNKEKFKDVDPGTLDGAIGEIQSEVDKFKKDGIDKVIVLSHASYARDVEIAKKVEGIDVIVGGHSHDLLEGITEDKNLFYSKKTGEPTIITQAGKNGDYFGVLNLEFDNKGVIKTAQNNVNKTVDFPKNAPLRFVFDTVLGKSEKVGAIATAVAPPKNPLREENPHANFLLDAVRSELKTDLAIVNSPNLRGGLEAGPVFSRDITGITPFKNKMLVVNVTEKELIDGLEMAAKRTFAAADSKPGLIQVSGMKYTVTKSGKVLDLKIVDKNGKENAIDVKNPSATKTYTMALDNFYGTGGEGFTMFNKNDTAIAKYDFDKDKLAIDFMKKQTKPVDIKADGRITVVD